MEINEIKYPRDVYQFIDDNIEYGWIDINNILKQAALILGQKSK